MVSPASTGAVRPSLQRRGGKPRRDRVELTWKPACQIPLGILLMKRLAIMALSQCLLVTTTSTTCAENWLGFQNGGQLTLDSRTSLPTAWNIEQGIAWDVALAG